MPNTQTSVPAFVASQVLTAQQQTEINTGIPVFATTVTRDAAFGGSGEKTLAEGQFAYIEATNTTQYYDGAAWQPVGASSGLTLVSATTIGTTVSSVTVTGAFSATYDNYKIVVSGGLASASTYIRMTLGATATGYYYGGLNRTYAGVSSGYSGSNVAFWEAGYAQPNGLISNIELFSPFLSARTSYSTPFGGLATNSDMSINAGFLNDATSYTAFTLTPNAGTITGGTIRVYGYANS